MTTKTPHPTRAELQAFYQGRSSGRESRAIVRHLLTGCEVCKTASSRLWTERFGSSQPTGHQAGADYAEAFDRAASRALDAAAGLERERREAPALFRELQRHPAERQELLIRNSGHYQTYGLCELVLLRAFDEGFREPPRAVQLARLGVQISDQIPVERYGERIVADLRGRAWGILGNAHRNASAFADARDAFQKALDLLTQGTGDPLERAHVFAFQSALYASESRYAEALEVNRRALEIHRAVGDEHMVGKDLSQEAFIRARCYNEDRAIALWEEALEKLDAEREPRMIQVVRHSLAVSYVETGRLAEADRELARLRPEYVANGNTMDLLRCDWAIGQLRVAQGRATEAEALFTEVRDAFVELGIGEDAALVNLDLAQALFDQGKIAEMRERLTEAIPIFRGLGIHREAIAALLFLEKTAEMDRVTGAVIRATARFLKEVGDNPDLVFEADKLVSQA